MASISDDGGGRKRILVVCPDGVRRAIRLGKCSAKQAQTFRVRVEALVAASITGSVDDETSRWRAGLDNRTYERLAAITLVKHRKATKVTLRELLDAFFQHLNVKPITMLGYQPAKSALLEYFGGERCVREIEPLQADQWRAKMKAEGLAEATISKRVSIAKHVFRRGVGWKMLEENPFAGVRAGSQINKARQRFISKEDAEKVLDACPDTQWRLLFALSRYAGLRCPSEHLALKWADVDWEHGRLRVTCSKTERIEGRGERFCPIFPELRPYLLKAFEEADPGTEYVITRYRQANCNLRTQLERIIRKAGLSPWPRLFHNLRATRQSELTERFPAHVVATWIGNTEQVAQNHYLQVTDAHFAQASAEEQPRGTTRNAAQNPAQYPSVSSGFNREDAASQNKKAPVLPGPSDAYGSLQNREIAAAGLEPATQGL